MRKSTITGAGAGACTLALLAALAVPALGFDRSAEPFSTGKRARKALDYATCITSITMANDWKGVTAAITICSRMLLDWWDE